MIHKSESTSGCGRRRAGSAAPTFGEVIRRRRLARVAQTAQLQGESAGALIPLAGRMPEDLPAIVRARPRGLAALLREASGPTSKQLETLVQHARRLNAGNRRLRS